MDWAQSVPNKPNLELGVVIGMGRGQISRVVLTKAHYNMCQCGPGSGPLCVDRARSLWTHFVWIGALYSYNCRVIERYSMIAWIGYSFFMWRLLRTPKWIKIQIVLKFVKISF